MKEIVYDLETELKEENKIKENNLKIKKLKELSLKLSSKFNLKNIDNSGVNIVALIFGNSGKAYFFSPGNYKLNAGDIVKVHDSSNIERLAGVVIGNTRVNKEAIKKELRPVLEVVSKNLKK